MRAAGQHPIRRNPVFHQRIHAAQPVLVGDAGRKVRPRHRIEPAQHAELGLRVAELLEYRHPHQRLDFELVASATKDAAPPTEARRLPQFTEHPPRAQYGGRFKLNLRLRLAANGRCAPSGLGHSVDHCIQRTTDVFQTPEDDDGAFAEAALLIAERLDELDVAGDRTW